MSLPEQLSREDLADLDRDELEDLAARQFEVIDGLHGRVESLEQTVDRNHDPRLDAFQRQLDEVKTAIVGSADEWTGIDPHEMEPVLDQVQNLAKSVASQEETRELFEKVDGKGLAPDDRAIKLRQSLLNRTDRVSDPDVARLDREAAGNVLMGSLHKGSVLGAMRRAADGHEANIDGASDLEPVDAIAFHRGGTVGSDGEAEQSYLEIDRSRLTPVEARQILTTGEGEGGGST